MQRTYQFERAGRTSLNARHVAVLVARGTGRDFAKGASIQQQGSESRGFWLVERGQVTVCRYDQHGGMTVYGVLGAGDLFGELAYFADIPRQVDAFAETDARLVWVDRQLCDDLLERDPGFARLLLSSLANQLRVALNQVEARRLLGPRQRLASFLVEQDARSSGSIAISQQEIADLIGVSRVTIGTLLREFRQRGLIASGYRAMHVLDAAELSRIAAE